MREEEEKELERKKNKKQHFQRLGFAARGPEMAKRG